MVWCGVVCGDVVVGWHRAGSGGDGGGGGVSKATMLYTVEQVVFIGFHWCVCLLVCLFVCLCLYA